MPKEQLFKVIKPQMQMLQGSVLLDAIFMHFWREEKKLITWRAFIPFLTYFILANFYYMQCMYRDDEPVEGIWEDIQWYYIHFGNNENPNWTNGTIYNEWRIEKVFFLLLCWGLLQQIVNESV